MTLKTIQSQPTAPPPSTPSTPSQSRREFWEGFLSTPLTFTSYELALHSSLRLDAFTLELAKALSAGISIPSSVGARLADAITRSLDIPDPHRRLTGLQKITGKLSSTDSGLRVLCIVGAVCEYYVDEAVVPVFGELARLYRLPLDLAPAAEQWQSLTQLSAGFAEMAGFRSLVDRLTALGAAEGSDLVHVGGEDIAGLLCGMGALRRGEQKTMLAFVGRDAGWVAAVAEWLFELRIVLRGRDNRVLYTSCGEQDVQFDVSFQKPGVPCDGSPPVVHNALKIKERM